MYVFAQIGVSLPHNAAAQYGTGSPVSRDQLQPGDLVFFNGLGHVGIYIGGGQFIHSPHTGDVVKISSLSDSSSTRVPGYAQDLAACPWRGARPPLRRALAAGDQPAVDREGDRAGDHERGGEAAPEERVGQAGLPARRGSAA